MAYGRDGIRTHDLSDANRVLSQLSHSPREEHVHVPRLRCEISLYLTEMPFL